MAYVTIPSASIVASEPTKQELFKAIKDNLDDHETRIATSESALQKFTPLEYRVVGSHYKVGAETDLETIRVANNITLTAGRLWVTTQGTSGALQIDIKRRPGGGGPFTTIFSLTPNVAFDDGDFKVDTGILATTAISSGDFLRLDVDAYQVGLFEFYVQLEFTVN